MITYHHDLKVIVDPGGLLKRLKEMGAEEWVLEEVVRSTMVFHSQWGERHPEERASDDGWLEYLHRSLDRTLGEEIVARAPVQRREDRVLETYP